MKLPKWNARIGALAVAVALILVLNPEVRALLLIANTFGLEVIALLVVTQIRAFVPIVGVATRNAADTFCSISLRPTQAAMHLTVGILLGRQVMAQPVHAASIVLSCVKCRRQRHTV